MHYTSGLPSPHSIKRSAPKPGTKRAMLLEALLSADGITSRQAMARGVVTCTAALSNALARLRDDYGHEIERDEDGRYRIVGRLTDEGYVGR